MWNPFARKQPPSGQNVTTGRFELEQDGHVAYLEYSMTDSILALIHTEVPEELRGKGLGSELTKTALQWARDHNRKIDVICPSVAEYLKRHAEYSDLILRG